MLGLYLSGTGNTKHCTEKLVNLLDETAQVIPIESEAALKLLSQHKTIILGYPIQYSNIPVMVRDFITYHTELWKGKQVLCLVTMGLFSGDGAGCSARLLRRCGAKVLGGIHLKMPDSICDVGLLKKPPEENRALIAAANKKLERWAERIRAGDYPQEGLHFYNRLAGFFGQRLWFYGKTRAYTDKLKISEVCTSCGLCVRLCPMDNLRLDGQRVVSVDRCTMCYRCVNSCPTKAITLLGKKVIVQYHCDTYLQNGGDGLAGLEIHEPGGDDHPDEGAGRARLPGQAGFSVAPPGRYLL